MMATVSGGPAAGCIAAALRTALGAACGRAGAAESLLMLVRRGLDTRRPFMAARPPGASASSRAGFSWKAGVTHLQIDIVFGIDTIVRARALSSEACACSACASAAGVHVPKMWNVGGPGAPAQAGLHARPVEGAQAGGTPAMH